jgi:hypothetical protein
MKLERNCCIRDWVESCYKRYWWGGGKTLQDPAWIGRFSATDLAVPLKPMGLQLSYMQEKYKPEYQTMWSQDVNGRWWRLCSASPVWHSGTMAQTQGYTSLAYASFHFRHGKLDRLVTRPALFMVFIRCLHKIESSLSISPTLHACSWRNGVKA